MRKANFNIFFNVNDLPWRSRSSSSRDDKRGARVVGPPLRSGVWDGRHAGCGTCRHTIRDESPPLKLLRGSGLRRVYVASSGSMDKVGGEVVVDSRRLLLEIIISCCAISVIQ